MEFEIQTMQGNFKTFKKVLTIQMPNKDNPYIFKFIMEEEEYIYPKENIAYCKQIKRRKEE